LRTNLVNQLTRAKCMVIYVTMGKKRDLDDHKFNLNWQKVVTAPL